MDEEFENLVKASTQNFLEFESSVLELQSFLKAQSRKNLSAWHKASVDPLLDEIDLFVSSVRLFRFQIQGALLSMSLISEEIKSLQGNVE